MKHNWTEEQEKIFTWFKRGTGNLVIEARAGAAKTTTLLQGLNYSNVDNSLYMVFNKTNQTHAEKNIHNPKVTAKTLHSIGFSILRYHWRGIVGNNYVEYERIAKLYPDAPKQAVYLVAKLVSHIKNLYINPTKEDFETTVILKDIECIKAYKDEGWTQAKLVEMAMASVELCKQYPFNKKVSFDDMIFLPCALDIVKPCYNMLVIDEFQDVNLPQFTMASKLINSNGKFCVVGDPKQNIYNFRGSLSDSISAFEQKFKSEKMTLSTTFRCPKLIVGMAQQYAPNIKAAPNAIDGEIKRDSMDNLHKLVKVNDFVLSRTNAHLMRAFFKLFKNNLPVYIEGKDMGKILINLIDIIDSKDMSSFANDVDTWLAAKQPAKQSPRAMQAYALAQDQASALKILSENCLSIQEMKEKIELIFKDAGDVKVPSVVCMTVHKSKGREADNIFILKGSFSTRVNATPEEVQEEQNIRYVAITRTKKILTEVSD